MAARYTEVTFEDMLRFLKRGFRSLRPRKGEQYREIYFDLGLSDAVAIRVWTSIKIGSGMGAGVGQDAIRVQLVSIPKNRPLMKGKAPIVKRTQNWRNNLQKRVEDYIEDYEDREEYWEERAGGTPTPSEPAGEERPPPPDGVDGPPPTDGQVRLAMGLVESAPANFNWSQYGFDEPPNEEGVRSLCKRSVSKLIDALKMSGPAPVEEPGRSGGVAKFKKLRNGAWGLQGQNLVEGDTVVVQKRDGTERPMQVGRVLMSKPDGYSIAEIARSSRRYAAELLEDLDSPLPSEGAPDLYGPV